MRGDWNRHTGVLSHHCVFFSLGYVRCDPPHCQLLAAGMVEPIALLQQRGGASVVLAMALVAPIHSEAVCDEARPGSLVAARAACRSAAMRSVGCG